MAAAAAAVVACSECHWASDFDYSGFVDQAGIVIRSGVQCFGSGFDFDFGSEAGPDFGFDSDSRVGFDFDFDSGFAFDADFDFDAGFGSFGSSDFDFDGSRTAVVG